MSERGLYKLVEREPVACDFAEWHSWIVAATQERQVGLEQIGDLVVSTMFIGIDQNHGFGRPLLFETQIFDGDYRALYPTWADAAEGHASAVAFARVQDRLNFLRK